MYDNFKSPIWNISKIYMATAQSTIFCLLRIYHSATAHLIIIYLLQINQLFHHWKSSKNLISLHPKFYEFTLPISKHFDHLYGFCEKPKIRLLRIYNFPTANCPIIRLLQIFKIFHKLKLRNYLLSVHIKIVWQLQIAYFEPYHWFICLLRKAQIFAYCASIILLLRISQLFIYCKSTNYFTIRNRLHNWLLCIEKLYDNYKSPISKYFEHLYGYWAKPNFLVLRIKQLFSYCASPNYLSPANRQNISQMEIV